MDNKETLKTYYETGDKPTQEQFEKLIYACVGTLEKTDDLPVATSAQENVIYQIGRAFYQCKVLLGIYGWQYIGSLGADGKVRYDAGDVDGDYLSNRIKAGNDIEINEGTGTDENKAIISLKEITLEAPTATDTPIIAQNRITVLLQNLLNLWKGLYDGKLGYLQVVFSYSGETLTSTKTVAEILAAINANKQIIACYSALVVFLTENITISGDMVIFTFSASTLMVTITGDGSGETDSWTLVEENIEKTSNKVSEWSETPTDTNYPTEKLVKDTLVNKADLVGGLIPSLQLPSFVDDVIELRTYSDTAPTTDLAVNDKYYAPTAKLIYTYDLDTTSWDAGATPERGKIYVVLDDSVLNKQYRWGGSDMAAIVNSDIAGLIHASDTKDIIVDADEFGFVDTENSNVLKKTTWSNIKSKIQSFLQSTALTITEVWTFTSTKLAIKGSSTGKNIIASANTGATNRTNTLPDKDGTFAMTNDIKAILKEWGSWGLSYLPSVGTWFNASGNERIVYVKQSSTSAAYMDINNIGTFYSVSLPSSQVWSNVFFANQKFIALSGGINAALSEDGGETWSALTLPSGTWNNGCGGEINGTYYYVLMGTNGTAIYSSDLENWITITFSSSSTYASPKICYIKDRFIFLYEQNIIAYTDDLITFTDVSLTYSFDFMCVNNYVFSNSSYEDLTIPNVREQIILLKTSSTQYAKSFNGSSFSYSNLSVSKAWTNIISAGSSLLLLASDSTPYISYDNLLNIKNVSANNATKGCSYNDSYFLHGYGYGGSADYFQIIPEKSIVDENLTKLRDYAKYILFDNTVSNLQAKNVQDAIKELAAKKEKVKYDASDPTAGYLVDKCVAGDNMTITEGTGANENKLVFASTGGGSGLTKFELTYYQAKPATCTTGETCFDTSDGKIYTATATDTWGSGVAASTSVIYIWKGKSYLYVSGTKLVRLDNLSPNVVVLSDTVGTAISAISSYSVNTKLFCQLNNTATTRAITISAPTNDACCELTFENNTASAITITFPNASGIVNYPYSTSGIIISAGLRRTISWEMTGEASSTDMNIFWGDEQTAVS